MGLMVVLMTIKDRFTIFGCKTLTVPTTSQRGQRLYLLYSVVHYRAPDCEVAEISPRGSLGSPCLVLYGGDYDPRTVHCFELCYAKGIVTISIRWYTSCQSKTIRIVMPAVMGGSNNVFRD
uniref:Retrotransposon protein, putative, Ty3-gypsy subclass n=2 Tax=Oryza sativa subsp. japonica TaxID=39947 RepID=Q53JB3_ORYSJ|nr:hypothetical protein [Oryza sativa Japonica Group]ABA93050.1 retrotransposon protein, putative, Ty3-gypsy subclass [Oryza sativa Japonica Group]